jgi:hypothetical protein
MSNALDSILEHLQKDPTAKYLFQDDESETSTIIENPLPITQTNHGSTAESAIILDNDTQMTLKEHSGTKRQHSIKSPSKIRHGPDPNVHSSPNRSPPSKKRPDTNKQPSAKPDDDDRERGQS